MLEDLRKYVDAALGLLSPERIREGARSAREGGPDQAGARIQELLEWSRRARERIGELIQAEVRRQLSVIGVATKDDLDALRRRVRELETGGPKRSGKTATPSRAKAANRSAKGTAKRPARKAGRRTSGGRASPSS